MIHRLSLRKLDQRFLKFKPSLSHLYSQSIIRAMSSKGNPSDARVDQFLDMETSEAKWIKLQKIKFTDPAGKSRDWEMAARTTRAEGATIDGVGIIAVIEPEDGGELRIVLQKQFRPPVEGVCIEIPAGLVDPNEDIETCALRELKEETGYIGSVVSSTRVMFNDPGFTNTNMVLVTVQVDLKDERNQNPVPELEDNEFIETFTEPLSQLPEVLDRLADEGYILDARLECVAHGITVARQFGLK